MRGSVPEIRLYLDNLQYSHRLLLPSTNPTHFDLTKKTWRCNVKHLTPSTWMICAWTSTQAGSMLYNRCKGYPRSWDIGTCARRSTPLDPVDRWRLALSTRDKKWSKPGVPLLRECRVVLSGRLWKFKVSLPLQLKLPQRYLKVDIELSKFVS